jgi:anti-anti-sigma factor
MKLQITSAPNTNTLRLAGDLDIYNVETARQSLLDFMAGRPGVELDLSGVESCDTAGLQLLLAAHRSAATSGKTFSIQAPVAAIEQCGQSLGLGPESLPPHTR